MNFLEQQKASKEYYIIVEGVKLHVHHGGTAVSTSCVSFPNGANFNVLRDSLDRTVPFLAKEMASIYTKHPKVVETVNDYYGIDKLRDLGKALAASLGYPQSQFFWTACKVSSFID